MVTGDPGTATQFTAVTAVADGFVVTGSMGLAGERPIALHSTDGATWTREAVSARPGAVLGSGAAWDAGLLLSGRAESARCPHPGGEMDVWLRSASATWTEAPFDPEFCAGGGVRPVIFQDRAWMIGSGVADVPFVLASNDGLAWENHRDRLGDVFVDHAFTAEGRLCVLARALDGSPIVLSSRDGVTFERRPVAAASGRPLDAIASLALGDRIGLIVDDGSAIGLLRSDGPDRWQETPVVGLPRVAFEDVVVLRGSLLALGSSETKPQEAWSSADGATWMPVPLPTDVVAGAVVSEAAVSNGVAVLVGHVEAPGASVMVGAIWMAPASVLGS